MKIIQIRSILLLVILFISTGHCAEELQCNSAAIKQLVINSLLGSIRYATMSSLLVCYLIYLKIQHSYLEIISIFITSAVALKILSDSAPFVSGLIVPLADRSSRISIWIAMLYDIVDSIYYSIIYNFICMILVTIAGDLFNDMHRTVGSDRILDTPSSSLSRKKRKTDSVVEFAQFEFYKACIWSAAYMIISSFSIDSEKIMFLWECMIVLSLVAVSLFSLATSLGLENLPIPEAKFYKVKVLIIFVGIFFATAATSFHYNNVSVQVMKYLNP